MRELKTLLAAEKQWTSDLEKSEEARRGNSSAVQSELAAMSRRALAAEEAKEAASVEAREDARASKSKMDKLQKELMLVEEASKSRGQGDVALKEAYRDLQFKADGLERDLKGARESILQAEERELMAMYTEAAQGSQKERELEVTPNPNPDHNPERELDLMLKRADETLTLTLTLLIHV